MKIGFGSDHAAIELKACLLEHLQSKGYECVDYGAYSPDQKVDYPIAGEESGGSDPQRQVNEGVTDNAEQASGSLLQPNKECWHPARVSALGLLQPRW